MCRRSPRGERGLKYVILFNFVIPDLGRSPRGERGLKYVFRVIRDKVFVGSLPPRGAWIEILVACKGIGTSVGRSPRGERGLKF